MRYAHTRVLPFRRPPKCQRTRAWQSHTPYGMQVTLADAGRFVDQDPIGLIGGANLYAFAPNTNKWLDVLGLNKNLPTPYPMRALPPGSNQKLYTIYRVLKPIDNIAACKIMLWFGEIGLGTQYELPKSIKSYIESGHLEEVKIGKC